MLKETIKVQIQVFEDPFLGDLVVFFVCSSGQFIHLSSFYFWHFWLVVKEIFYHFAAPIPVTTTRGEEFRIEWPICECQFIETSHGLTLKGSSGRKNVLFQANISISRVWSFSQFSLVPGKKYCPRSRMSTMAGRCRPPSGSSCQRLWQLTLGGPAIHDGWIPAGMSSLIQRVDF